MFCELLFIKCWLQSFINGNFDVMLDGHNNLVTPDPVPNSEVKLVMFVFVLSMMGTHGAVCFYFLFRYLLP